MNLEKAFREAARAASGAVEAAMEKYRLGHVTDEDDLTGVLIGRLDAEFDRSYGGINWSSSILRHRKGIAAQEKQAGADMLIHVSLETPSLTYSKGILVQAKRVERDEKMTEAGHKELMAQCKKMLNVTPASFVFDYSTAGMRCGSAIRVSGSGSRDLYSSCHLTPYRFFLELFRCTTGDTNITSPRFDDLKIPTGLHLAGRIPEENL